MINNYGNTELNKKIAKAFKKKNHEQLQESSLDDDYEIINIQCGACDNIFKREYKFLPNEVYITSCTKCNYDVSFKLDSNKKIIEVRTVELNNMSEEDEKYLFFRN